MGYVKLHDQLFSSSVIEEDILVRWVWVALLLSCDKNGNVYGTVQALARKANVEVWQMEEALGVLMRPDPSSTSKLYDGRRIIDVGQNLLHCVNYLHYRGLKDPVEEREKTRKRVAKHRKRKKCNAGNKSVTKSNDKAESIGIGIEESTSYSLGHPPPADDRFDEFWTLYPRKVQKKTAKTAWKNMTKKKREAALAALPAHILHWDDPKFIPHAATWLRAERWEDDLSSSKSATDHKRRLLSLSKRYGVSMSAIEQFQKTRGRTPVSRQEIEEMENAT